MIKYKNPVSLPPFEVKNVVATLSQTTDWGLINLKIPDTWTESTGKDITVLIIDTGCPVQIKDGNLIVHPDLDGAIQLDQCKSFIDGEGIEDFNGHSSMCAGIIGARNNDIGCVGYAPNCTIITYKGLDKYGSGGMYQIAEALEYAANYLKPDIVSMSLGSTMPDERVHKAIKRLYDMNIVTVCAGGNGGSAEGVNYPGEYDEVITIAAYDKNDWIAKFSAVGDGIDFAFPGVDIYSTYLNGGYAKMSGTSFACPAAAGVVALLLAKHKKQEKETGMNDCKTVDQIKEHLRKYSIDYGVAGRDKWFGWGIVDVSKMITAQETGDACTGVIPQPEEEPKKSKWQKVKDWLWLKFSKPF